MQDEVLGELSADEHLKGALRGSFAYHERQIHLLLWPNEGDLTPCLALAQSAVLAIDEIDEKAKCAAAREMLGIYNSNWREYLEIDRSTGRRRNVSNPQLDEEEFKSKLMLTGVSISGRNRISAEYDDCDLFMGHSIIVTSSDGLAFSKCWVELTG